MIGDSRHDTRTHYYVYGLVLRVAETKFAAIQLLSPAAQDAAVSLPVEIFHYHKDTVQVLKSPKNDSTYRL